MRAMFSPMERVKRKDRVAHSSGFPEEKAVKRSRVIRRNLARYEGHLGIAESPAWHQDGPQQSLSLWDVVD